MELSELVKSVLGIFEIKEISELKDAIYKSVTNNQYEKYEKYLECVGDLSVDNMQKIFQYHYADRKEKMQDYTPKSLAILTSKLTECENEQTVYDMCAGSGALTIQKWNTNILLS